MKDLQQLVLLVWGLGYVAAFLRNTHDDNGEDMMVMID